MGILRAARTLTRARVAIMAAVVALVAATCSPAVGLLSARFRDDDDAQQRQIVTLPANADLSPAELAEPLPVNPSPAPAQDISSAVVQQQPPANSPTVPAPAADFGAVTVHAPRIRISGLTSDDAVKKIRQDDGVSDATGFILGQLPVGAKGRPVTVAAVDPVQFRAFTPQETANAVAVWQRIVEGDAAFTHDTGTQLEAKLGTFVPAGTEGTTLRVGAFATNGVPPVADAIVNPQTASQLGLRGVREALVSIKKGADPAVVAKRLARITGARVDIIEPPQAQRAFLTGDDARSQFEPYTYIDNGDGTIQIDPDWVRRNIISAPMPLLKGEVVCHRLLVPQLYGALAEIEQAGLGHLIDPSQYGGCWVARHIDWSPSRPLSMHSWGLAADFNVSTNQLGARPQLDGRIVKIFDRWGFVWGGRWSRPDGMHFELGAVLQSPQG